MKNINVILLIVAVFMSTALSASAPMEPKFVGHEKMGFDLKREWQASMSSLNLEKRVKVMIRLSGDLNAQTVKTLEGAGLTPINMLKTVITGSCEVGNIPYIVEMDEVKYIDVGQPMGFKPKILMEPGEIK